MTDHTAADQRLLDPDVAAGDLDPLEVAADQPAESIRALAQVAAVELGVWQIEPGTAEAVEEDEAFVVVAGAGTLTFDDGSGIELRPGTAVRLRAGDRTTWTITEPLRKVYVSRLT